MASAMVQRPSSAIDRDRTVSCAQVEDSLLLLVGERCFVEGLGQRLFEFGLGVANFVVSDGCVRDRIDMKVVWGDHRRSGQVAEAQTRVQAHAVGRRVHDLYNNRAVRSMPRREGTGNDNVLEGSKCRILRQVGLGDDSRFDDNSTIFWREAIGEGDSDCRDVRSTVSHRETEITSASL